MKVYLQDSITVDNFPTLHLFVTNMLLGLPSAAYSCCSLQSLICAVSHRMGDLCADFAVVRSASLW